VAARAAAALLALARTSTQAAVGTVVATFRPLETAASVMARAVDGDGSGSDPWVLNDRYVDSRFGPAWPTRLPVARGSGIPGPIRHSRADVAQGQVTRGLAPHDPVPADVPVVDHE